MKPNQQMKTTIECTRDYSLFQFDPLNRDVKKLTKIARSMRKHGFLKAYPIACINRAKKLIIKDGQHRFESAKLLKLPVYFVIDETLAKASIPEINNTQQTWKWRDYIASFRHQGKKDYAALEEFAERSRLPLSICASILANELPDSTNKSTAIKQGTWRVTSPTFAEDVLSVVKVVQSIAAWARNSYFIAAVARAVRVKQMELPLLIEKIKTNPAMLRLQPTIGDFLSNLEDVYNHRSRRRIPLRFLAEEESKRRNFAANNGNGK